MKIYFGGQDPLFELSDHHKAVIAYNINADELEKELARYCEYWLHLPAHKHAHINQNLYKEELASRGVRSMPIDPVEAACLCYSADYQPVSLTCKVGNSEFQYKASHMLVNMSAREALRRDLMKHWDTTAGTLQVRVDALNNSFHGYQGDFEKALSWVDRIPNPDKDFPDAAISAIAETEDRERMVYILKHKYEQCLKRLKLEWNPKFASSGIREIPVDDVEYCNLVFSRPDYKDKKSSDMEKQ